MDTPYSKVKGPIIGYCAICQFHSRLTYDHVPPQACGNIADYSINDLLAKQPKREVSQGGLKYRTLCSECNNTRLGGQYDPDLVKLVSDIMPLSLLKSRHNIIGTSPIGYPVRIHRLLRAVFGHVLATDIRRLVGIIPKSPFDEILTQYFLDETLELSEEVEVYYWPYLHSEISILRAISLKRAFGPMAFGHVFKFYPIAFWIVFQRPQNFSVNLPKLLPRKNSGLDDLSEVFWDVSKSLPAGFPEMPGDDYMVAFDSKQTMLAKRHLRRNVRKPD